MNWIILIALVAHWYISLFCQTFFLHRYGAHGMFTLPYWFDRTLYFLTFISQGPSFLNPRAYALLHQAHHKYSDTEKDPHSPHFFPSVKSMMLKTFHDYHSLVKNPVGERADHYYPSWRVLDKFATSWIHTLMWGIIYFSLYSLIVTSPWQYLFLVFHFLMGPMQGAAVNWFGHMIGYRNFSLPDKSKNTLPIDFLLMGELYQNNHHKNPMEMNFAKKWFEVDPTYPIIWVMLKAKLLRVQLPF